MKKIFRLFMLAAISTCLNATELPVQGIVDLHTHPAMHLSYGFMFKGGTPESVANEKLGPDHAFDQHMYTEWVKKSGTSIIVAAAIPNIFAFNKEKALQQIEEQMQWLEEYVEKNKEIFALAKNPEELRKFVLEGKVVFVHGFEGAEFLIDTVEDAKKWAQKGVALIAPIHLADNFYGEAAIMNKGRRVLNWRGVLWRKWLGKKSIGLTPRGIDAIKNLHQAGIIIDVAHMNEKSVNQVLDYTTPLNLPIVSSHGYMKSIVDDDRAWTNNQLERIYKANGLVGITLGRKILPPDPAQPLAVGHCLESVDDYVLHFKNWGQVVQIPGPVPALPPMAIGSDYNGFVDHFKPCENKTILSETEGIDKTGFRHPGDLGPFLEGLKLRGLDITPFSQSAERFIQIWEKAILLKDGIVEEKAPVL